MEYVMIKDIKSGQKNLNVVFIILEVGHPTITKESREVRTLKVADSTACMNVSIWDEPGQLLVPGDIVKLTKGYASMWRQCLTLYSGKTGDIQKIGDFCMVINEQLNMSEPVPQITGQLINQSGTGSPGSNAHINNTITNNGNANNLSTTTRLPLANNSPGPGSPAAPSSSTKSGNNGGGSTSGTASGGGGGGGNSGGSSTRFTGETATKNTTGGKSGTRGRGGYRNGGRNERR